MSNTFKPKSFDVNTQTMANYLPDGELYIGKNIGDSKFRKLLKGLAHEFGRTQEKLWELSEEHNINTTVNLIEAWESALGIPDDCFTNTVSIDQRRLQVIAKFAKMNLTTAQDWINLAKLFGYDIQIIYPENIDRFDYTFDFYFFDDINEKFTMIVKFLNANRPEDEFDQIFDFTFQDNNTNMMRCLFDHLKPAHVKVIYEYAND